jgi:ABC-2 type transport system permease protein
MNAQARAIVWAQVRMALNYFPRSNKGGIIFGIAVSALWYGLWSMLALVAAGLLANANNASRMAVPLSAGLALAFVYWQVIPVLMATTGASLDMKKLLVYPIPHGQLFTIEVLLRVSSGMEVLILLIGAACGLWLNPRVPGWAPLFLIPFIVFNLCFAAGTREILIRLFARKRVREIAVFLLVLCGALPQLLVSMQDRHHARFSFHGYDSLIWPWAVTAQAVRGAAGAPAIAILFAWTALAYLFGRWQFERGLRFDVEAARATPQLKAGAWRDALFTWPSLIFRDPLGALVEKEIRFLARSPRFRLVFTMGFTFGLVIWLPMASRSRTHTGVMSDNYLTLVCVYALMLLGDVCFWNTFGFDRKAAQMYFVAPVKFRTVLIAKNIAALFFILLEITAIILVCSLLRMPVTAPKLAEAYGVTLVITLYLVSVGNITSVRNPRATNPEKSMRSGSAGQMQAMLVLIYPLAALPVFLAYAARYAFDSDMAFFIVLGAAAAIGVAVYTVAIDSSVETAHARREQIVEKLSQGDGVIQA